MSQALLHNRWYPRSRKVGKNVGILLYYKYDNFETLSSYPYPARRLNDKQTGCSFSPSSRDQLGYQSVDSISHSLHLGNWPDGGISPSCYAWCWDKLHTPSPWQNWLDVQFLFVRMSPSTKGRIGAGLSSKAYQSKSKSWYHLKLPYWTWDWIERASDAIEETTLLPFPMIVKPWKRSTLWNFFPVRQSIQLELKQIEMCATTCLNDLQSIFYILKHNEYDYCAHGNIACSYML